MLLVFSTYPSKTHAKKAALSLIRKRLVACANIYAIESLYMWKGKMHNEKEWVLELKTAKKNYSLVKKELISNHPYELPAFYASEVLSDKKFEKWVSKPR
ncbi:MAG: divalent-cation tolerance protein CutA [Candidatus Anstonellales archaeon]